MDISEDRYNEIYNATARAQAAKHALAQAESYLKVKQTEYMNARENVEKQRARLEKEQANVREAALMLTKDNLHPYV